MRIITRSLRQLRPAFKRQKYNFSCGIVEARNHFKKNYYNSIYRLANHDEVKLFKYHSFRTSGALSPDSEKLKNEVTNANGAGPLVEYERRIANGELVDGDSFQIDTLEKLQRLYDELVDSADMCQLDRNKALVPTRSGWLWSRLLSQPSYAPVKGLYLYGGVGTGKTMLMDLFFDQLPSNWRKKRIHFHDFMLDIHSRLQKHKGVSDPLDVVAGEISEDATLLCLDEFMVTDVADALILNRLFRHLFGKGIILVATSNRAPDNLYEGGLQRDLFLPFIDTLKERCVVHEIGSSTDYRKLTSGEQGFYLVGKDLSGFLKQQFQQLIGDQIATSQDVEVVMGRTLHVPLGANGCAYFTFEELCDRPIGAADYFGLFKEDYESDNTQMLISFMGKLDVDFLRKFHTLALQGIPIFGLHNKSAAHRFVTLIDVIYENRARLLCTAEGSPQELFERIVTIAEAKQMAPRTSSRSRKSDDSDLEENRARLLCTAEGSPQELFERIVTIAEAKQMAPRTSSRSRKSDDSDLCVDNELGFAKDRTISRLTEINSKEYLEQHAALLAEKQLSDGGDGDGV